MALERNQQLRQRSIKQSLIEKIVSILECGVLACRELAQLRVEYFGLYNPIFRFPHVAVYDALQSVVKPR